MQIESEILTVSMITTFFGAGFYETASPQDQAICRNAVMEAYQDACLRQSRSDEADEREKKCEALRIEIDYINSILAAVCKNPINSSSVNLMIASLPCEREFGESAMDLSYTSNASHASNFVMRLLDKRDIKHFYYTFNSLRYSPRLSGPDSVILLIVALEMYVLKLTQRRNGLITIS